MSDKKPPDGTVALSDSGSEIFEGREEIVQLFKRGAEFYEELLKENERLRYRVVSIESELETLHKGLQKGGMVEQLQLQLQALETEREALLNRFKQAEAASQDFASRYTEIEEEHNRLANLYIASYQLHSTLNFGEVVRILLEIAINLIGIGRLVLYILDRKQKKLFPIAGDGLGETFNLRQLDAIDMGQGVIGSSVAQGQVHIADPPSENVDILACLPLMAGDRAVGALVLEKFLQQKNAWSDVDHELFNLLSAHAGTALLASALNASFDGDALQEARVRALISEQV